MKRLELLDYGRFFAAIIVVLFHYTFNGIANGKISSIDHTSSIIGFSKYGYLGVELFFMISGYVIFFSAKTGTASKFAISRAIRLYPAYWFAVLFTSFFALQWGGDLMQVHPKQIAINLSMLQSFFGVTHVDGVYWTLVYEITFYCAILFLLLFGLQRQLHNIFICWPALFFIAILLDKQNSPYLGSYFYYFSAGALFAVLKEQPNWRAAISLLAVYVLCINFSASKATYLTDSKGVEYSPLIISSIITAFFAFFAYQNSQSGQSLRLPLSKTAGALTYPIYLIHAHFGYMLINRFATNENKAVIYLATILLVILVSLFINKIIEIRLAWIWKSLISKTLGQAVDKIQGIILKMAAAYNKLFKGRRFRHAPKTRP